MTTAAMRRIAVVGSTGAGKTTLAKRLALRYGLRHVELDALFHGPNWMPAPLDEFRARVAAAIAADGFVVDGNYGAVRDIVWSAVDTLVWLDYSLPLVFARTLRRTIVRIRSREELWNGNREGLANAFASRDSILLWVLRTHARRRRDYPGFIAAHAIANVVRLGSPDETEAWFRTLELRGSGQPPSAAS